MGIPTVDDALQPMKKRDKRPRWREKISPLAGTHQISSNRHAAKAASM
jgi:hypothetical protein